MPHAYVLTSVGGGNALSPFRAAALVTKLRTAAPSITDVSARYVHWAASDAELDASDPRDRRDAAHLRTPCRSRRRRARTPRWSSSPPGSARCRRGRRKPPTSRTAAASPYDAWSGSSSTRSPPPTPSAPVELDACADLLHDRMTESALPYRRRLGVAVHRARGGADGPRRRARPRPYLPRGGQRHVRPGALGRRDRLPRRLVHDPRAQPHRRRAHDVRPGELGALPPQDLQRRLRGRRRRRRRSLCSA